MSRKLIAAGATADDRVVERADPNQALPDNFGSKLLSRSG